MVSYNFHFLHPINILAVRSRACERIASALLTLPPPPSLKILSLVISSHPYDFPPAVKTSPSRVRFADAIDLLLKIIYIYFCSLFVFTQATRYFLIILLIDASFLSSFHGPLPDLDARRSRTKMTIDNDFCSRPLSLFWKIAATSSSPPWDPEGPTLARSVSTSSRWEEKIPRDIPPEITNVGLCLSTPCLHPFQLSYSSLTFVITYIRLFSRKKHTRVVKPLKSKNHNVFGTQASESFFHE